MSISVNYISTIEKQVEELVSDYRLKAQQLEEKMTSNIEKAKQDSLQRIETITTQKKQECDEVITRHREQSKQDEIMTFEKIDRLIIDNESKMITTILGEVHKRYGSY